jgi:CubicO group peptidase (beta-lactamase class C family)
MVPSALEGAQSIVATAIRDRAFPAATVDVGTSRRAVWQQAFGRLSFEPGAAPTTLQTLFDIASLTKVIATTTVVMHLVDEGRLALEDPVGRWIAEWVGQDREAVTVRDLLAHCAGLSSYLPFYRDHQARVEFERAIASLPLEYVPRTRAVYSDLGFILLGFICEDAGGRHLEALWATLAERLGLRSLVYRPPRPWRARTAPTQVDAWRGRLLVGEVDDRNAWALGGVAGHAGLFGTAPDVGDFARAVLRAARRAHGLEAQGEGPDLRVRPETLRACLARSAVPGSSRALGWDTMLPTSSCGTRLSPTAVGHTGFTGTSLWIDWERDLYAVLLTNRVHPDASNDAILGVRPAFHDAVLGGFLQAVVT